MKNFKIKVCYVASVDMAVRFILFGHLKFLKKEGYAIYTVCSTGSLLEAVKKEGIEVKTINFHRGVNPFLHLITFFRLLSYFKKEKFDIVHTHTPVPAFLGQLAAKMAGVPIIINTVHGFYFQERDPWLKRKLFILIEKISGKHSNLIFLINKEDVETAAKEKIASSQKIKYLGEAVDFSRFDPKRFSNEFTKSKKRQLGINPQKRVVGIVARLVKEKGYLELFEAFREVLKKFPDTLLLIIGPKEFEKKDKIDPNIVKNYGIEKKVIFLGKREDVDEIYPLMDIFVLPSHREGLGISIVEASGMEKPVIATNIRGCREAAEAGKTGILVPVGNPEKLAEAIIYLFKNPEKAKEMGKRGREKLLREFDERIIFSRIKIEYERLIKEKL